MYWQRIRCLKVKDGLYSTMYLVGIFGVFLLLTHSLYSSLVLNKVVVKNVESLPQNLFFCLAVCVLPGGQGGLATSGLRFLTISPAGAEISLSREKLAKLDFWLKAG